MLPSRCWRLPLGGGRPGASALASLLLVLPALGACAPRYVAPEAVEPAEIPRLEAARASRPDDLDAAARLGAAYRSADRLDDARQALEAVLSRDPGQDAAIYFLGLTYEELGADSAALALYGRYAAEGGDARLRDALADRATLVRRRLLEASVRAALDQESRLVSVEPAPGTVAVFPFDYVGSDPGLAPLGRALAEMLTTDLSQTERLVVLERARAQVLVDEMALAGAGVVDPATAARGGRILGAHRVVQGQLDAAGEEVTVEARLVGGAPDAHTSEGALRASDRLARFFDLEKLLALDIYRTLGVELTAAERERVTRNRTESVEALIAFGLGLEAQDQGRWEDARTHFDQAVRTDPSFEAAAAQLATSETLANAASQGLDALADLGADLVAVIGPTSPDLLADQLLAIEQLVPGLLGRDPLAEFLGNEGLTPTVAVLELILRRPGGDE